LQAIWVAMQPQASVASSILGESRAAGCRVCDKAAASRIPCSGMLGRLAIAAAVVSFGLVPAGAGAGTTPRDAASTHAYLEADYAALHAAVTKWPEVEGAIHKLDSRFRAECPNVGAGSPQSEEEQKLSLEAAGALWATGYHTNASALKRFVAKVGGLRWSNAAVARGVRAYTTGLREMVALQVPDLCGDVRVWTAGGFKAASAGTQQFDRHVEAIEVKEVPRRLLAPYEQASDRGLAARVEHLADRYGELEFSRGQSDWNALLEVLALNQ